MHRAQEDRVRPVWGVAIVALTLGLGVVLAPTSTAAADPAGSVVLETSTAAHEVVASSGRVTWYDDSTPSGAVRTSTVRVNDGSVTAGAPTRLTSGFTTHDVRASGTRTGWVDSGGDAYVVDDGSGTAPLAVQGDGDGVSGTRVAYQERKAPHHRYVFDQRTRRTVDTTSTLGATVDGGSAAVALWGDYYVYSHTDGSVWRKDLTRPVAAERVAPPTTGTVICANAVYAWGDWVAWTCTRVFDGATTQTMSFVRDMAVGSAAVKLPDNGPNSFDERVVGASAVGPLMYSPEADATESHYLLYRWSGASADVTLPQTTDTADPSDALSVSGSVLAWIGTDDRPRVAQVRTTVVDRPRALGAPDAASSLPVGGTWHLDLPTSATLTSCAVRLQDATGDTIKDLPCADDAAAEGDAVVDWDGSGTDGHAVAPGAYRWTVVASNEDGSLLAADGSTSAVTGTITVAAPALFHPLTPARLLDTREGIGGKRPGTHGQVVLQVAGRGGVPSSGVTAVTLTLTAIRPDASGFVTAYASGTQRPATSNLNISTGRTVALLVTASLGRDGRVVLYNGAGSMDLTADVAGYYTATATSTPGAFVSTTPTRLIDTRAGLGDTRLAAHGNLFFDAAGLGPVPARGASSLLLSLTAVAPAAAGYLRVQGPGLSSSAPSSLNFVGGRAVANLVTVEGGDRGPIEIANGSTGATDVVVDIVGYYVSGTPTASGAFVSAGPARVLDTRTRLGGTRPGAHGTVALTVAGKAGLPMAGAGAVVVNLTATHSVAGAFVTAHAHGSAVPRASNLNVEAGQTVADLAVSPVGSGGQIDLYNGSRSSTDLIADIEGWFRA